MQLGSSSLVMNDDIGGNRFCGYVIAGCWCHLQLVVLVTVLLYALTFQEECIHPNSSLNNLLLSQRLYLHPGFPKRTV